MTNRYRKIVREINSFDLSGLDDSELSTYSLKFKEELSKGRSPEHILPQALAVIKEVFDRRLGIWKLFDADYSGQSQHQVLSRARSIVEGKRASVDDSQIHLDASFYRTVREMRQPGDGLTFMPFDVQLLGALALYEGKIAEMGTGEGKTLVAVFPACLWALSGKKVHIATVNDYLAYRDCAWMGPVFKFLGLKVDCVLSYMSDAERREAYKADVVYGNNYEFGFDYLRDNIKNRLEDRVQSKLEHVIIDEIDSILMDEATTPLIISGAPEDYAGDYWKFKPTVESLIERQAELVERLLREVQDCRDDRYIRLAQIAMADPWNADLLDYLNNNRDAHKKMSDIQSRFAAARSEYKLEEDLLYVVDEKHRTVKLTDRGIAFAEGRLGSGFLTLNADVPLQREQVRNFLQLLRAYVLYRRDEDYIVHNGGIVIVDEFTGRLAFGKKYEEGLHQAIECKESLRITAENLVLGRITHTNYFRLYEKMAGMTATAHTQAEEFKKLYNLEVVRIPANRPIIRADLPDRFYRTEEEKLEAVVDEIKEYHSFGRPVLVGTRSVEKSERLSALLAQHGILHNILNAKNHAQEAEIIKSAGQPCAVTIATNMAGRGTDIALGKNLHKIVIDNYIEYFKRKLKDGDRYIQVNVYSQFEHDMLAPHLRDFPSGLRIVPGFPSPIRALPAYAGTRVLLRPSLTIDFGLGLHVIGTERHGARRIDDQLKGRSGRQGDPGSSRFYQSLQDDLFRIFGREETVKTFDAARMTRLARRAQRKSEEMGYTIRKQVIEWDDVSDKQRKTIYRMRSNILSGNWTKADFRSLISEYAEDLISQYVNVDMPNDERNLSELKKHCLTDFGVRVKEPDGGYYTVEQIRKAIAEAFEKTCNMREHILGADFSRKLEKAVMLDVLETAWTDYLSFQSEFDRSISLRSYVKGNILADYRLESSRLFNDLLASIRRESLRGIFSYPLPGEKVDYIRRAENPEVIGKLLSANL